MNFLDDAGRRRGHVHGRLFGFERDERRIRLDGVARLDEHVNDGHVLEVAYVGHAYFNLPGHYTSALLDLPGIRAGRVNAELHHRRAYRRAVDLAFVGEALQCCEYDEIAIDFKMLAQRRARIRTAIAVGAERDVTRARPLAYEIRQRAHIVGRGDDWAFAVFQALLHMRRARRRASMQHVPALALERLAPQLGEARHRKDINGHLIFVLEHHGRRKAFAQDRAGSQERRAYAAATADLQQIHALQNSALHTCGHRGLMVVLVHAGDVIENALLLDEHAAQPIVNDHRKLIRVGRIIGDAVGHRGCHDLTV